MATKKMTAKQIGVLGERLAISRLTELGYELIKFGAPDGLNNDLPHAAIWIGGSHGHIEQMMINRSHAETQWVDPVLPEWADLTSEDTTRLAQACKNLCKFCTMIMSDKSQAPCSKPDAIFDRNHLESINPQGMGTLYIDNEPVSMHGGMFAGDCSRKFNEILGLDMEGTIVPRGAFMRDNAVIDQYIKVMMEKKDYNLPHSGSAILAIEKKDKSAAEQMKNENRKALDDNAGILRGAPGRYDFIGHKGGVTTAIEVKVNSSKMTYLQQLRFKLLNKAGHNTMLVHIRGSKEDLAEYQKSGSSNGIEIELLDNPSVSAEPAESYPFSADFMKNSNDFLFSYADVASYRQE